jgi:glycosyltransferase involved in cell wall biosynthesis
VFVETTAMNILVAHNFYREPGGEDQCVAAEVAVLKAHGHDVSQYYLRNDSIDAINRLRLSARTIWSRPAFRDLKRLFRTYRPQIAHFHNTLPLISPAAYYAARAENVRVVQTLHNFRLCCVNAVLFRDGKVCESCLGLAIPWHGIVHRCYRGSLAASAAVTTMTAAHRLLGTWRNAVDVYIAPSDFSRSKLVEGGLPADQIVVKPNFVHADPGPGSGNGGYAVYVGRLSAEKGVETLLKAWCRLGGTLPLKIVGDGPLAASVHEASMRGGIHWLRSVSHETVLDVIGDAAFLILPSQCYETFGRVVVEAFAKGTPAIVSGMGAMAELVDDGHTGLHFKPGDAEDLVIQIRRLLADPLKLGQMREAARRKFVQRYTADANHRMLMAIYERALGGQPGHGARK